MCLCRGCVITHTNSRVGSEDKIVQGSTWQGYLYLDTMWRYTMLQNRVYSLSCMTNIVCINRIVYTCIYILMYPRSCMSITNSTQCYELTPGIKRRLTHFELHPTRTLWYTLSPELPQALLLTLSVSLWLTPPTETRGSPLLEYVSNCVKDCISAWTTIRAGLYRG
jgi:hypothetical protein